MLKRKVAQKRLDHLLGRAKFEISGVEIIENFVSAAEELQLVADLDKLEWDTSQSGRRKQNFGPRANFKKRKVKAGQKFCGFPQTTEFVQRRFDRVPLLRGYQVCSMIQFSCLLFYHPRCHCCKWRKTRLVCLSFAVTQGTKSPSQTRPCPVI